MKITIDTNEISGKIKQGIKKYGKYAGVGAATKTASLLGKKMKEKADREAIKNRMLKYPKGAVTLEKKLPKK